MTVPAPSNEELLEEDEVECILLLCLLFLNAYLDTCLV